MLPRVKARKDWQTLDGRLEWLLVVYNLSGREFSTKAGFRNPTQINTIIARLKEGGKIEHDTLIRIQRATRVSWEWLMVGRGSPWGGVEASSDESDAGSVTFQPPAMVELEPQEARSRQPNKTRGPRELPSAKGHSSGTVPTKLGKRVLNSLAKEEKKQTGR